MKKNTWMLWIAFAVVSITTLAIVLWVNSGNDESPKFHQYKQYASELNVVDWTISQDTAESFAQGNCDKLAIGSMPAIKFQNEDHVKSSASVLAAYCPDSLDNFLAGIIMKYPEFKDTAMYINDRIEIEDAS